MSYILAILVGFAIIISMVQNARLVQHVNIKQVTLLNFMTGVAGASIIFFFTRESLSIYQTMGNVPLFGYVGGLLGVIAVTIGTLVMRKVSVIAAAMLMYTGQLLTGVIIDYFRGTELSTGKIIGCGLIIAGVYFNSYIDSRAALPSVESL